MFNQTFRNIGRTREIIGILVKYGFEDIVVNSTLRNFVSEKRRLTWLRQERPVFEYTRWERIRMAAEDLGPTFVKMAQILSNRPDMIPEPLIRELEKLQDNVGPFPYKQVREIINRETGKDIEDLFIDFTEKPIASASIGQVHKAKLKNGDEVVIKVQRPGVRDLIERDLAIVKEAVTRTERYLRKQGIINAMDVVRTFERGILKELDYNNEARNMDRFRNVYHNYRHFYIPKPYRDVSTEQMLVIEFVDGCKFNDVKQMRKWGLNPAKIAEVGIDIYLTMIFEFGYFHADPHPGNVLVRKDGVICLLDFGMVGQLMEKDKFAFAGVFISLAQQDSRQMAVNFKKLAIEDEIHDMRMFEYDLNDLIEDYANLDVSESSIADMINSLQKIMYDYQLKVPGGVFLIFRAFAILEGIGKTVHPHFNTYEFIKPYGLKILKERFKPETILNDLYYRVTQLSSFANSLPFEIKDIMGKFRKGKIHFEVEHQGYGYLLKKLDSLTNRMILTAVMVALILGSSIMATADFSPDMPTYYGVPQISVWGFWVAGILGLILTYATLRRRKYR